MKSTATPPKDKTEPDFQEFIHECASRITDDFNQLWSKMVSDSAELVSTPQARSNVHKMASPPSGSPSKRHFLFKQANHNPTISEVGAEEEDSLIQMRTEEEEKNKAKTLQMLKSLRRQLVRQCICEKSPENQSISINEVRNKSKEIQKSLNKLDQNIEQLVANANKPLHSGAQSDHYKSPFADFSQNSNTRDQNSKDNQNYTDNQNYKPSSEHNNTCRSIVNKSLKAIPRGANDKPKNKMAFLGFIPNFKGKREPLIAFRPEQCTRKEKNSIETKSLLGRNQTPYICFEPEKPCEPRSVNDLLLDFKRTPATVESKKPFSRKSSAGSLSVSQFSHSSAKTPLQVSQFTHVRKQTMDSVTGKEKELNQIPRVMELDLKNFRRNRREQTPNNQRNSSQTNKRQEAIAIQPNHKTVKLGNERKKSFLEQNRRSIDSTIEIKPYFPQRSSKGSFVQSENQSVTSVFSVR